MYLMVGVASVTEAIPPHALRFIVHESLNGSVIVDSATVFNYTAAYSLTAEQVISSHRGVKTS